MKKTIITLMGLFALVSCSEDVYNDINQENADTGSQYTTNSFESDNPGWIDLTGGVPFINPGTGYQSPWDIWYRNHPFTPNYTFSNRGGSGHTSPLKLEITPWVGLAYFDDNDDGFYTDLALAQQTGGTGVVANLNNGNYPHLFLNNQEVGNMVPADVISLDGSTFDESELTIASDPSLTQDEHLLVNPANKHASAYNNLDKVFSFSSLTTQEQDLLMKYGKVFYYEVKITERVTGNYIGTYFVQYRNESLDGGYKNYQPIPGYNANTPGVFASSNVFYYHDIISGAPNETQWPAPYPTSPGSSPNYTCNSREVVIEQVAPFNQGFVYNGTLWRVYVTIPIGSYLWQTSGPMLIVEPQ